MIKSALKRGVRSFGIDVVRFSPFISSAARFSAMLNWHRVNLVFDVGANVGQFGKWLRLAGYEGRIVSVEPLGDAWTTLKDATKNDRLWEVAPRCAIGAEEGELEIHVSGNSHSSSALKMLDAVTKIAPGAAYVRNELVPVNRLDSVGARYADSTSVVLIKIDTQGYEDRVLAGASGLLKNTVGVRLELNFVDLYEGQSKHDELVGKLGALGFDFWDFEAEGIDRESGRVLWGDATFFRRRHEGQEIR